MEGNQPTKESSEKMSKEQIKKWYKDQIEMVSLRHELTRLQSETIQFEAKRFEAIATIGRFTQQPEEMAKSPQKKNDPDSEKLDGEKKE